MGRQDTRPLAVFKKNAIPGKQGVLFLETLFDDRQKGGLRAQKIDEIRQTGDVVQRDPSAAKSPAATQTAGHQGVGPNQERFLGTANVNADTM